MYSCGARKGVFLPLTHFKLDRRFDLDDQSGNPYIIDEDIPAINSMVRDDMVKETVQYPSCSSLVSPTINGAITKLGKKFGIQGEINSSYIDATMFSMFAFSR